MTAVTVQPPPTPEPRRILVIDDDEVILLTCRRILVREGYEVETFPRGSDGIERLKEVDPQVLIVDLKMPGIDGFQVIELAKKLDPDVSIIVITGYATVGTAVDAMKAGAHDFLPKPFTPDELRLIVNRCWERWRLKSESRRLRYEKEEAERRFVTFVSHQLKSPAAAVKQYLDVLAFTAKGKLDEASLGWIERSQARLRDMLQLIEDWLTLSKVERGAIATTGVVSDLPAIVEHVVQAVRPQAEAAGVALGSEVPPDLPAVRGESVALSSVVSNLLVNAVKYNRRDGAVQVRAAHEGGEIVLSVSDTGCGIPEENLPLLFTEFYRVATPETRDIPGTGLGLAICKRIVGELGGTIHVLSKRGEGSTFTVRLPVAGTAPDAPQGRTDG